MTMATIEETGKILKKLRECKEKKTSVTLLLHGNHKLIGTITDIENNTIYASVKNMGLTKIMDGVIPVSSIIAILH